MGGSGPILGHSLEVQGQGHIEAHSILRLALATTYVHQHEIERACEVAVQALNLPSDQRIGPINQRARDLLRELEVNWSMAAVWQSISRRRAAGPGP